MIMTTTNVLTILAHPIPESCDNLRIKLSYKETDIKELWIVIHNLFFISEVSIIVIIDVII